MREPPPVPGLGSLTLIGVGGFGSVWQGAEAGAAVAIKVSHAADDDARTRLKREAAVLGRVGPPRVPACRGQGVLPDGRAYLVMEHLAGHTLAQEIEGWRAPPPLARVRAIGSALLESAAALHEQGVVHRDLKPENVFLVATGAERVEARLMDFGLSQVRASAGPLERTVANPGAGTIEYMAPEQIAGEAAEAPADVYALGLLLYEIATLRLPFTGDRRELEYAHLSFRPARPSDFALVPEPIEEVILRCLAKDPAQRYADAGALRLAFGQALAVLPHGQTEKAALRADAARARSAPGGGGDRQKMVLVFAAGPRVAEARPLLEPYAGQMAHAQPGMAVYAFGHRAGHSPGQRALAAGNALLARGLAERLIVDVGDVRLRPRPGGPRLFSPSFTEAARYPTANDPPGILLTAAAGALVPSVPCQPWPGRPGHFLIEGPTADQTQARTMMPEAVAPLVGRSEQVLALLGEADLALGAGKPRVASVLAEPGLGKTRLAFELANRLRDRHPSAEVIELTAREPLGSDADGGANLAELLRRGLDLPALAPPDGGRDLLVERLGEAGREVYASAALLLGWIAPDHPAVTALRAAPGVLRANMARAGLAALRHLADRRPVVLVLDDVHWADDTLLDAIEQATASELPLWVCAFGRPVFAEGRPNWGQRAAGLRTERLGPLDGASAAELCRQLLRPAGEVPEPVITRLTERAEGVPLLLSDLVRGLRREGLVRQQVGGGVWYVATEVLDRLPDSPVSEWLADRELELLPPDLAAHARLLSLLSPEISIEEVEGMLALMERDLAEAFPLDSRVAMFRLRQLGLLLQKRNGAFSFRNGVLRDGVARSVAEVVAHRVHEAALSFYRAAPLPASTRTSRLAWHASRAGERREAGRAYLALAESARQGHNYLEADLFYTQALAHMEEAEQEPRLLALRGRGTMRYRLGRYEGSLEDLAGARELAARGGDLAIQADVMLDESMALDWVFDWRRSRDLAERARELVERAQSPVLEARLLLALGRSLHRFNQDREAVPMLRQAFTLAESIGDPGYEVEVTAGLLLGFILPLLGLLDEAEQRLDQVGRSCESKGDELHLAAMLGNRACLWLARNDRARFMADTQRVLDYARRMGSVSIERFANINSASFLLWRGEYDAAEPFARRIVEIDARYFQQSGYRPDAPALLARILWWQGEEAAAARLVDEVRSIEAQARAQAKSEQLLLPSDEVLLETLGLAIAGAGAQRWEPLLARAREAAQGQELIEVLELAGSTAQRRGDLRDARRWWQEALVAGERIPNVMGERIRQRLARLG